MKKSQNRELRSFETWLYNEEMSKNTINSYMYAVNDYFGSYDEISKENIMEWKRGLMSGHSAATVNLRLCGLAKYIEYKEISLPIKRVKCQKSNSVENVITIEQYHRLIDGLEQDKNFKWAAYIKIFAKTGMRISEMRRVKKSDLTRGYAEMYTKGKIRRILFPHSLVDEVLPVLDTDEDDNIFLNIYGKLLSTRGAAVRLEQFAEKYDIPKEVMHPHSFRHLFAIEFLKRNDNISLLADLMGHSGVNTTMIYARMSRAQQADALEKAVDW